MNDECFSDFVSAVGDEFSEALTSVSADICGVDVNTVITGVFPSRLSPELLAAIRSEQIEELRIAFSRYLEVADDAVTTAQITTAISRILRRWPPEK